ncbi:hypothetical protein BWR19_07230 [Halomonas sp. 1513]|nr:glycosyltransferase [Halomonas sp. 1513]APX92738.1 hypothetical protein BWR19_07230 [Halomonas sp. 1513]
MNNLRIYVFSYNRYEFLKNCVDSLLRNSCDSEIVIVDDCSEDPDTLRYLKFVSNKCRILKSDKYDSFDINGGLHENMMAAFNDARNDRIEYVIFIQDDMQLVRKFTQFDFANFERFFLKNENSMQLSLSFLKSHKRRDLLRNICVDKSNIAYLKMDNCPGTKFFSDTGLFSVDRFFSLSGVILDGEENNERHAESLGIKMGIYIYPLIMWLPLPVAYRLKKKNYILVFFEKIGRAGFYPYTDIESQKLEVLFSRNLNSLPFAEDYLECPKLPLLDVWTYGGGESLLYAHGGWRKTLARIYSFCQKMKKKLFS